MIAGDVLCLECLGWLLECRLLVGAPWTCVFGCHVWHPSASWRIVRAAVTVTCLRVLAGQQVPPARKQKTTRTPRARTRSCIPVNQLRVSPSRNRHQHTDLSKTTSGRQACISFRALRRQISLKLHKIIQDPTLLLFSFCIDRKVVNLNKPCRRSRPS